jgi:hypothetical protein
MDSYLIEVDIHAFELEVRSTIVPGSRQLVDYDQMMIKHTLQRHRDHVHQKWFACAVVNTRSWEVRRGVNEPKGCTNLVTLDKSV